MQEADFFICHASEDKDEFVRPFAHYLIKNQANIFYDEFSIRLGDSLSEKINQGLSQCKCAIVVLSKYFFAKDWTKAELQGVFQRHLSKKSKLILLYHKITHEEVLERLPLLADIYAVNTSKGISAIASEIFHSVDFKPSIKYLTLDLPEASTNISRKGFHIALQLQLNILADPYIDKFLIECGDPERVQGGASLYIHNNRFLVASFIDKYGRSMSLQTSIDPYIDSPALVIAQLSISKKSVELYTDGELVACLEGIPNDFLDSFVPPSNSIIFNSFDLVHPGPMDLHCYSIGPELTAVTISEFHSKLQQATSAIDRAIR